MAKPGHLRSSAVVVAPVLLVLGGGLVDLARAQEQVPCDFLTGSGKIGVSGGKASFGVSGGVKEGAFWGDLTYQDPGVDLKVEGTSVTKYSASGPRTRVVEGTAKTNRYGNRLYRVTATDNNGEGPNDAFQITLDNGYSAQGTLLSGNVKLRDGNRKSTSPPGYTCGPPSDTTPPTVSVTSPGSGSTVSGPITVSANATDDIGVAGVQFQLDGGLLGAEDTTAPYSVPWDTTTAGNGNHTLTAVARDGAGNTKTSSPVTVTVSNAPPPPPDTQAPAVSITSPSSGSTVSGTITVAADASDNVGVAGVQFELDGGLLGAEDTTAPYSVPWDTTTTGNGSHTLTAVARDAAGNIRTSSPVTVTVFNLLAGRDVFVSLTTGQVQWRTSDGVLRQVLVGTATGQASSLAFDAARNLYVPHWYSQSPPIPGNTVERFDANGNLIQGYFGSGYDCDPSSFAIDATGNVYVGQADCTGDILKFDAAGNRLASYDVPTTQRGTDHIYLAGDNCTMFYTSRDQNIYRYNVCTRTQLPIFNLQPLPGSNAYHLVVLPGGGVLVADSEFIVGLDAAGNQARIYSVPGEQGNLWGGVDFVGDGTFWASNGYNGNIYRFNIQTGAVLAMFNTGTGNLTAAGVAVRR